MLIGLLGKPSVGKSTFFKAATLAEVEIASYPFTTIKPNRGIGYVRVECLDRELNTKCNPNHGFCIHSQRFVPIDLMDVAGLVPGASEGKGLGNQFLDDLRGADIFIHIVDCAEETNAEGKTLEKGQTYDVCNDIKFLEEELNKWFFNILFKAWKAFARKAEIENSKFSEAVVKQFSGLKVKEDNVRDVLFRVHLPEKASTWNESQLMKFAVELRRESKPMILVANKVDLENGGRNYEKLKKKFPELTIIPCSADSELALRQAAKTGLIEYIPGDRDFKIIKNLNEKQKEALEKIKTNVLEKFEFGTGIQKVLNMAVFEILRYIAVFPASANKLADSKGNILPDCFLMPPNSTALDFAYYLHTDFGKNFIKAIDVRTKKALGKDYKLKQCDGLEIVTR
ncbi:MAG: redox-regulated ATPase YchF [Candidatus Diapherotrites archaeon]